MVHSSDEAFLGCFFIFTNEVLELKNKKRLSKLIDIRFGFFKKRATQMSSFSKNTYLREYKELGFL